MDRFGGKKNLIFDLGGVLFDIAPENTFVALMQMGVSPAMLTEEECMKDGVMQRFETGSVTEDDMFLHIMEALPAEARSLPDKVLKSQIADAWCAMIGNPIVEKFAAIEVLRAQGYNVFLLSNTNITHMRLVEKKLIDATGKCLKEYFDGLFLSYELGLRKPDEAIFEKVLELVGCDGADVIFFDDLPENCAAARRLGIESVVVERNASWDVMFV